MVFRGYPDLGLLVLLALLTNVIVVSSSHDISFSRTSFPKGFIFGTASASYQVTSLYFLYVNLYHFPSFFLVSNVVGCEAYDQYYYVHMCVLSNFQYEGAAKEDGRGASIWDTYTHEHPGLFIFLSPTI